MKKVNKWTEEELQILRNEWRFKSDKELAKVITKHSKETILSKRYLLGLINKTSKRRSALHTNEMIFDDSLTEYIDGLVLGDGNIHQFKNYSARIRIQQAESHKGWLDVIQKDLLKWNICSTITPIKRSTTIIHNKEYSCQNSFFLQSLFYPELKIFRRRWYNSNKKVIPYDLKISPMLLSQWYMGDGSLLKYKKYRTIRFYTDNFTFKEIEELSKLLNNKLNIHSLVHSHTNRPIIDIGRKTDIEKIVEIIRPFICQAFNYKINI